MTGKSPRDPSLAPFLQAVLYFLPIAVVWLVAVVVAVASFPASAQTERSEVTDTLPSITTTGSVTTDASQAVVVQVTSQRPSAVALGFGGVVTSVKVQPGDSLVAGDVVLTVDDFPVRAQVAAAPITGDVGPTTHSRNVKRVSSLLIRAGYLASDAGSDAYSPALRLAINEWNADAELEQDGVFRAASIVFASSSSPRLQAIDVSVGDRVDAGSAIATLAGKATIAKFAPAEPDSTLLAFAGQPITLSAGDEKFSAAGLDLTPKELSALARYLNSGVAAGRLQLQSAEGVDTYQGGILSLEKPLVQTTVPNSAVLVTASGATCIFVVTGAGQPPAASTAVVLTSEIAPLSAATGTSSIPGTYDGAFVVANANGLSPELRDTCE